MTIHSRESSCQKPTLVQYFNLLKYNRNYRLYLLAHCMQHTGDWFIRIASLLSVERLDPGSSTAISIIVLCKAIPEVLVTPFGGILSDRYDRKKLMMFLDSIAAVATLCFILAVRSGNAANFFAATVLRSSIVSLYEPVTKSIFPMFVTNPEDLRRAATLNGSAWSGMLLLGGVCGGYAAAVIGLEACFVIDCVTFILSAIIMSNVEGNFSVVLYEDNQLQSKDEDKKKVFAKIRSIFLSIAHGIKSLTNMNKDFMFYLWSSGFVACAFMKASGTASMGANDVLNASFSLVEGDEEETSRKMGIIFSCAGFGCLIGPFLSNATITRGDQPITLQLTCIGAFIFLGSGWFGIANAPTFEVICAFTVVKAMGEAILWMNASLLLQTLTTPSMLGRMLGFEYSVARLTEALGSFNAGRLEDIGYGKHEIASFSGVVAVAAFSFWSIFHLYGGGAANPIFNKVVSPVVKDIELL